MRFFALMPVRDEADIIGQCLTALLKWADVIMVFDTGSVDDTWEVVQAMAASDKRIMPLRKDSVHFHDSTVRGWLFHQARKMMEDGDWFLRVDADEFHHVPPPEFVRSSLRRHETVVWHQYYDFRLMEDEVRAWEHGEETLQDRLRPIEERRRWFTPSHYSEPRMCRYRSTMRWPSNASFPFNAGYVARERLPIRHYPHRDPVQLDRRCKIRAWMIAQRGDQLFTGYSGVDICRSRELFSQDAGEALDKEWRRFVTPAGLPELQFWPLGSELPRYSFSNHLAPWRIRGAQRLLHAFLLPFMDARRDGWREEDYPEKISLDQVRQLELFLKHKAPILRI